MKYLQRHVVVQFFLINHFFLCCAINIIKIKLKPDAMLNQTKLNGIGNLHKIGRFKAVTEVDFLFAVIVYIDWICNEFLSFLRALLQSRVFAYSCEWIAVFAIDFISIRPFEFVSHEKFLYLRLPCNLIAIKIIFTNQRMIKIRWQTRVYKCICREQFILSGETFHIKILFSFVLLFESRALALHLTISLLLLLYYVLS